MKQLTRITGRNFLAHPTLDIEIKKQVLLIAGQNATGKSSIKDIVEFVFTGKCPNRGVLKAKDQSKLRNNKASAKAQCSGAVEYSECGMTYKKTRTLSDGLTNPDGNRLIPFCLNPLRFVKLSSDERAALLASVYEPSEKIIRNAVRKHIAPNADVGTAMFSKPITDRVKQSGIGPYNLDALCDCIVDFRQQLKREKKAAANVYPELADYGLPADYTEQVKADGEALAAMAQQQLKVLTAVQVRVGKIEALTEQATGYQKQIDELEATMTLPPEAPGCLEGNAGRLIKLLKAAIEWGSSEPTDIHPITDEKGFVMCPTCGQEGIRMVDFAGHLQDQLDKLSGIEKADREYQAEITLNNQLAGKVEYAAKQLKRIRAEHDALADQIEQDAEVTDEAVAEKQQVVDNITAALENYTNYRTALALHEEQEKSVEEKTKLIDECNSIAAALADGGPVKSEIQELSESLPINPALLKAWGLHDFKIKSNGEIVVNGLKVELLSDSEQYRIAAAVGIALAEVGDVGFCCLDGFEILMPDKQNAFMENLFAKFDIPLLIISVSRPEQYKDVPDWIQYEWIE